MPPSESALHLLVPGLLGPLPALQQVQPAPANRLLETLLARASVEQFAGDDLESTLCALFGLGPDQTRQPPVAALRLLGQGGEAADHYWMQADPVCLRPDQDRLLLFDTRDLVFPADEAEQLADEFRAHFADLGWRLLLCSPHQWYLSLDRPPRITTFSLGHAFGRNIDRFLPQGEEALRWHGLLNEIQMLFHNSAVNQRRESRGEPSISGVWFHGGGYLPSQVAAPFTRVYASDPLARGLAVLASTTHDAGPEWHAADLQQQGGVPLIVEDALQRSVWRADPYDWCTGISEFSSRLSDLVEALRRRHWQVLYLYPCNGKVYRVTRAALRRFWRRPRPLLAYLDQHQL